MENHAFYYYKIVSFNYCYNVYVKVTKTFAIILLTRV